MPAERYYSPHLLDEGTLFFEGQEFHHMVNVMRARIGDQVEIVNGKGQLAIGTISNLAKRQASVELQSIQTTPQPTNSLILAQALPQLSHLEWIVEKATELGMTELWLFPSTRSGRKTLTESQTDRLTAITIAAMKQCGRLFLPTLHLQYPIIDKWQPFSVPAFFGDMAPNAPLLAKAWQQYDAMQTAIFCVGPEGGFTTEETEKLKDKGAAGVSLHPNILRTETAAVAALSLLSHRMFFF